MKTRLALTLVLCSSGAFLAACDQRSNTPNNTAPDARTDAGRTTAPVRTTETVRTSSDTVTPMDQSNSSTAIKITSEIRRSIMEDKAMSMNAQNCKIITDKDGIVTLRGEVESQIEKDAIESKAKAIAGVSRVINELEVDVT